MTAMKRTMTVQEVAEMLGISEPTIYRAIKTGEIPSLRVSRSYRVPKTWVEAQFADPPLRQPSAAAPPASAAEGNS